MVNKKQKLRLRDNLKGSLKEPAGHYEDTKVRFSLAFCTIDKAYCLSKLAANPHLSQLYKKLGRLEQLSWNDLQKQSRVKGFSIEKKDSENHKILMRSFPGFTTFGHFRVDGGGVQTPFRVFIAREKDLAYLLWFDRDGSLNH